MAISQEELKSILKYNPATGDFTNIKYRNSSAVIGCKSGSELLSGYIQITINYQRYSAHRLAWFYVTGTWPKNEIDHINHSRSDNRFCNLRESTRTENMRNKSIQKRNVSGVNGVRWYKNCNKWRVTIGVKGKIIHLGYFSKIEKAIARRKMADVLLGYHKNHGEVI